MASCKNILKIGAYHDGELSPDEAEDLARHIRQCPLCRQELERLQTISNWLSSSPAPGIPAAALARLRRSVQPRRDRTILRTAEALTTIAAAVLVVCSALVWHDRETSTGPAEAPAVWESAAIMPPSGEPTASDVPSERDTEDEPDVQLARSILGSLLGEGEHGYE